MPAVIATPCWSNIYSCPPHNYSLDALVEHTQLSYEVFTVATPEFMQQWWPQLYVGFYESVRALGSNGFLVTKRVHDCEVAADLGIACAVSNEETRRGCHGQRSPPHSCGFGLKWDADIMMSQEKWVRVAAIKPAAAAAVRRSCAHSAFAIVPCDAAVDRW